MSTSILKKLSSRQLGILAASGTGVLWATLAIALKVALTFTDSQSIAWFRLIFSFVALWGWMIWKTPRAVKELHRPPLLALLAGLGLGANYLGYMKGLALTSTNNTQVLIQIAPLTLILLGIFYFRERPKLLQVLGFLTASAGFLMFFRNQLTHSLANKESFLLGNIWILFGAFSWVVFAAIQKSLLKKWTPPQINLIVYAVASLMLLPLASWSFWSTLSFGQVVLLIVLGLNTVVAYGLLGVALQKITAAEVSIIISLNPLLTLLLMDLLVHLKVGWVKAEPVDFIGYLSAAIVVIGVALVIRGGQSTKLPKQTA